MSNFSAPTLAHLQHLIAQFFETHPLLRRQLSRAYDLVVSGGVRPCAEMSGAFLVLSSNGVTEYKTTANLCECAAGEAGRLCYHRIARRLFAVAHQLEAKRPASKPLAKGLKNHCKELHDQNQSMIERLSIAPVIPLHRRQK